MPQLTCQVLEEIRFGEGELPAGRWEQKPLNFKVMEDRLRANYDQYFEVTQCRQYTAFRGQIQIRAPEALTTKEDTKADAARLCCTMLHVSWYHVAL